MAKLVAGVKSVQSSKVVTVRVPVQKFQTTNGKRFETPQAANDEQKTINSKVARIAARKPIEAYLKQQGIAYRSTTGIVSLARLADAMLDPGFALKLHAIAKAS